MSSRPYVSIARCGSALEVGRNPVSPMRWVDAPPRGDRRLRGRCVVEREADDIGARARKRDRDRLSDAARGAGDDRAAAGEVEG